jgi:enoyl-CoA hydratase/carnithine racemase
MQANMIALTHSDGVATLLLSRPPVNAVSDEFITLFEARLDELATDRACKILHVRSDQKIFCAGADLVQVRERFAAADGPDRTYRYVDRLQRLYQRLEHLPQVTLAEIGGAAVGGGLELALACDLRIVAFEAKLGLPEARLGLIPGAGGTQRLTRLCGRAVASRLILGAEIVDGAEAARLGIAQWAVAGAELPSRAAEIAGHIAGLPAQALRASKKCIAAAAEPGNRGYRDELTETQRLSTDAETRERVAAFLDGH